MTMNRTLLIVATAMLAACTSPPQGETGASPPPSPGALAAPPVHGARAARPRIAAPENHLSIPTSVDVPGSYQDKAGCAGPWDPACAATRLAYDPRFDLWTGAMNVTAAGSYEYKVAIDGAWDENYGANDKPGGANVPLAVASPGPVTFVYDHKTHWFADGTNTPGGQVIAVAAGSFQSQLGCSGDWQPDCFASLLEGTSPGVYQLTTSKLRAGAYELKIALAGSWTTNFGAGGDPGGANVAFTVPRDGTEVLVEWNAVTHAPRVVVGGVHGDLGRAQAHWVTPDTIAWDVAPPLPDTVFTLHADPGGALSLAPSGVQGGTSVALTYDPAGLSADVRAKFPHLARFAALRIASTDLPKVTEILKGQIAVDAVRAGQGLDATALQIPGVLDAIYANDLPLGATFSRGRPTLRVWAPTARSVTLRLFDDSRSEAFVAQPMQLDSATGTWSVSGPPSWRGKYYLYDVDVFVRSQNAVVENVVTDPYSVSLSTNSQRSQIVDLADPALMPPGWRELRKPALAAPEDTVLYELHVRDFSVGDTTVPAAHRGTFLAFTHEHSAGMDHLARLARAGLTHVHVLPAFDFATVNEDKTTWKDPGVPLASLPPASDAQQAAVTAVADQDGFNWGYDPWHYTTPEGSYSTAPDGPARIVEFRRMVQSLNRAGLRMVMDVVYNHTTASGQDARSVLDRIVPGYYHRLDLDGNVETSTCCQNTASEHAMMEKLLIDSVTTWATAYKVDGFRFDLMSFHMKSNILKLRARLDALSSARDDVDGRKIVMYGEGWNFGEVADNARGVNATQANMAGTGIGTFSDRLRDAVRGGGPFSPRRDQGLATGLLLDPNGTDQGTADDLRARLLHDADLTRLGLVGNLADYAFVDATGATVTGRQVDYNGQPAGYAGRPDDIISYISAHDDETWFDALDAKLPQSLPMAARLRDYAMGISFNMLGQSIPFFHAGDDILRSKSGDKNSFNSGDWFNRLDFTLTTNGWGAGLPPSGSNGSDWGLLGPLLADASLAPSPTDIRRASEHFEEMLRVRKSSTLFRLGGADRVKAMVEHFNTGKGQIPGLIVTRIARPGSAARRDGSEAVLVFNATPVAQTFQDAAFRGHDLELHPVLRASTDPVVRTSRFDREAGAFAVPARTTAVFVDRASHGCDRDE